MTNDPAAEIETSVVRNYDLAERTAQFGETTIRFAKGLRPTAVTKPLLSQLVRAATSIGANYLEADKAGSKKELRYRISVCKREARETQYWLRMVASAQSDTRNTARDL
jgi:four helix bundle protein